MGLPVNLVREHRQEDHPQVNRQRAQDRDDILDERLLPESDGGERLFVGCRSVGRLGESLALPGRFVRPGGLVLPVKPALAGSIAVPDRERRQGLLRWWQRAGRIVRHRLRQAFVLGLVPHDSMPPGGSRNETTTKQAYHRFRRSVNPPSYVR
jgi:hypothetical protein